MRTGLSIDDLGGFLDEPLVAVLATLRQDGSVLLSPIWFEWRDGGFNLWVQEGNAKTRHLRRDPRATIVVAESAPPLRGVEVRGTATFVTDDIAGTQRRIVSRYSSDDASADDGSGDDETGETDVIVRIEPGNLRAWDYADEYTD